MRSTKSLIALVTATLMLLIGTAANAQQSDLQSTVRAGLEARLKDAAEKIETACGEDAKSYCDNVTRTQGKLLLCMMAHEDKISTKCDFALYSASRNLDQKLNQVAEVADACWSDIETHCANPPEGPRQVRQCLTDKAASLSFECRIAVGK